MSEFDLAARRAAAPASNTIDDISFTPARPEHAAAERKMAERALPSFMRPRPPKGSTAALLADRCAAETRKNARRREEEEEWRRGSTQSQNPPEATDFADAETADEPEAEDFGEIDADAAASAELLRESERHDEEREPILPEKPAVLSEPAPPNTANAPEPGTGWDSEYYKRGEIYFSKQPGSDGLRETIVKFAIRRLGESAPEFKWVGEDLLDYVADHGSAHTGYRDKILAAIKTLTKSAPTLKWIAEALLYEHGKRLYALGLSPITVAGASSSRRTTTELPPVASRVADRPSGFVAKREEPKPEPASTPRFIKPRPPPTSRPNPYRR